MGDGSFLGSREIAERFVVKGLLKLQTPAHFGGGGQGSLVDMPLLLDPLARRPVLTGASLSGALRNYLRERELGYRCCDDNGDLEVALFGYRKDDKGEQSYLIVDDALAVEREPGVDRPGVELRDGVAIDPFTRTSKEKAKFDFELLEAGTAFPLQMELLIPYAQKALREKLLQGLAIILQGLERGEIPLGARKRRGFGRCKVEKWGVQRYDLSQPTGLLTWLAGQAPNEQAWGSTSEVLPAFGTDMDNRRSFTLQAVFGLRGSLIIRSGSEQAGEPDAIHLRSRRDNKSLPVLSGTSLAGALRARARRIALTIGEESLAEQFITSLFGTCEHDGLPVAGRLAVAETELEGCLEQVVSRVKIDRFTGGTFPAALFSEAPLWGQPGTSVRLRLRVENPGDQDIGALLLLLKDLWTADLPLGGEAAVGRGRLWGRKATLRLKERHTEPVTWLITANFPDRLTMEGDKNKLEDYVRAFLREVGADG
ncbi:MAG: RAMP superfamily CRISPR-associated protein [Peptococcaceae bacterium]|nr:RAMP superfamily CRISPR-associated protein [Peptococcaceae bacterium]